MDTDDIVIHHEILERLAFKDFYLSLYDSKDYCGMFVHIEFEPKTKDTFIGIVLVGDVANEKENYAFLSLPAWIKEGQTLTEATRSTKQYIEKAANQRSTTDVAVPDTMERGHAVCPPCDALCLLPRQQRFRCTPQSYQERRPPAVYVQGQGTESQCQGLYGGRPCGREVQE